MNTRQDACPCLRFGMPHRMVRVAAVIKEVIAFPTIGDRCAARVNVWWIRIDLKHRRSNPAPLAIGYGQVFCPFSQPPQPRWFCHRTAATFAGLLTADNEFVNFNSA